MGKLGFAIGLGISTLIMYAMVWILYALWNALAVYGILGIVVFVIFFIVIFWVLVIIVIIAIIIPLIAGAM